MHAPAAAVDSTDDLIRLQCHEGIDAAQAHYDWGFPRQLLHLRTLEAASPVPSTRTPPNAATSTNSSPRCVRGHRCAALRLCPARRGPVDPRRTPRAMLAAGGEPVRPSRHHKATCARRVVLLIDVSGSINPYADALLRFAHVVTRANPSSTEVFSLGTRLTRLSRALRAHDASSTSYCG